MFKKIAYCILTISLAACSWQPVYYRLDETMPIQTASVKVAPVANESGRILVSKLNDLLNPSKEDVEKKYTLTIVLSESLNTDQGILGDNTSTRATMRLTAHFKLAQADKILLNDKVFASSSYNILMLPYPTVTAENTTRKRLIEMLADNIAMRIAVFFNSQQDKK